MQNFQINKQIPIPSQFEKAAKQIFICLMSYIYWILYETRNTITLRAYILLAFLNISFTRLPNQKIQYLCIVYKVL